MEHTRSAAHADPTVSIVVPVFNEEENLKEFIERCLAVCDSLGNPCEIILVDDGSTDRSGQMIEETAERNLGRIVGVFLNRNYGQHAAVMAGFARSKGGIVVTLDADLQNPPEEIPRLVEKISQGFDVVGSVRVPRRDSPFRRAASWLINKAVQKATGILMNDYGCMLRAYRRPIVNAMLGCQERSTFVPVLANGFARRTTEIEVMHQRRTRGSSKYGLWKLIQLQFDLLTSMTTYPLRVMSAVGGALSILGVAFAVLLLATRLIYGAQWAAEGVFTLFAVLFLFLGAQFVGMGLLGEYLGRIYQDVRARPRYIVESVKGKSDLEEGQQDPRIRIAV
ncbi:MAG: undecaprenyl-phosphate 4-deoxy-4-formamido-L-arabinose transferase [Deltaproteobacteria bacterium HGW-Deltaproteobacteria-21]|nr:MAG: undecaprenyl-phosphate 4-deoxy-4-formamido-L-arabinose transferase [Deltaproteobacteria bacterium HGW-Deltaproteobacteria-21]